MYHPGQYPYGAIGPASFIWRQFSTNEHNSEEQISQLWIWIHPSCFDESLEVMQNACANVHSTNESSENTLDNEGDQTENSKRNSIIVTSLQFDLSRFRLTGPLAHALLVDMLEVTCEKKEPPNNRHFVKETSTFQDTNGVCESNNNSRDSCHQQVGISC